MLLFGRGLIGFIALALWAYCILDVIATDESLVRSLPKLPWLFIVVFVPTIGAVAWLLLGRPEGAGFAVGGRTPRRAPIPPPHDPRLHRPTLSGPGEETPLKQSREEAIRRYEEEKRLRKEAERRLEEMLGNGDPSGPPPSPDDDGPRP